VPNDLVPYPRYRFPPSIISHAVWLYYRFTLSFRDVEDLLAHRGITVSYESIRHWCETFGHMRRFKLAAQAQRFLAVHDVVRNLFTVGRHRLRARHQRLLRSRAFTTWSAVAAA
jgi:transposase-like protein